MKLPSLAAALLAGSVSAAAPVHAETDYPWCSLSPKAGSGEPVCRFVSLAQCQAAVFGSNGWCERNARVVFQEQQTQKRGVR
jgi:hypothetical protein